MLLMIDNYDSFTYNLVQYFGELGADVRVFRNDEITVEQIAASSRTRSSSRRARARRPRRHLGGGHPGLRRQDPAARRVPRPPEHRRGLRRQASSTPSS
jgi:hypothetical protein